MKTNLVLYSKERVYSWLYIYKSICSNVSVEALGVVGLLNKLIDREERRHHRIIHSPVHVDQTQRGKVLMPGEPAVEHRRASEAPAPSVRVAEVAPSVVTQTLLHRAGAVGNHRPRAEVVLQDVMQRVRAVHRHHNRIDTRRAGQVRETLRRGVVSCGFRDVLAVPNITFRADRVAHMLLHEDPLAVVAVGVGVICKSLFHIACNVLSRRYYIYFSLCSFKDSGTLNSFFFSSNLSKVRGP